MSVQEQKPAQRDNSSTATTPMAEHSTQTSAKGTLTSHFSAQVLDLAEKAFMAGRDTLPDDVVNKATEAVNHAFSVETRRNVGGYVEESVNGILTRVDSARASLGHWTAYSQEQAANLQSATDQFVDARLRETDIDKSSATFSELATALGKAILQWVMLQFQAVYLFLFNCISEARSQITDEYNEFTFQFYFRWLSLIIFSLYDSFVQYLPVDRENVESTLKSIKSDYVDANTERLTGLLDAMLTVREKFEPVGDLKDYAMKRGAILSKGISQLMPTLASEANLSDSTDASPADREKNKTVLTPETAPDGVNVGE